ncbi:MAG: alanine racemase [Gammaproteobacteria bacterium]|nr:alanine racemase [Gammaproteobacteria bacterium]MBT8095317.1 alanine racemase [Gammaproteobacteria bacterium]NNF49277.1 alanine racemase [Woeseiaceae bacterium]
MNQYRRTAAFIDLEAIRANYALALSMDPGSRAVAVIKADAYGHGMVRVARALEDDAPAFAVATIDEAMQLREAGIDTDLLVLEGAMSEQAAAACAAAHITLMVNSTPQADFARSARGQVWVKVDTGMRRLGIDPQELDEVLAGLRAAGVPIAAVCTHLACADRPDNDMTRLQIETFLACANDCGVPLSIANSAGLMAWPASRADWNRPGIMLYGLSPLREDEDWAARLRVAMRFAAEVIAIRDVPAGGSVGYGARWTAERPSRIATLAAGYADGYPRHAPDGTPTFVNGQVAPLVGTISMDMITIDVTDHPGVAIGDLAELWGPNVAANDIAVRSGTIGYELLTGVSGRVPRIYD